MNRTSKLSIKNCNLLLKDKINGEMEYHMEYNSFHIKKRYSEITDLEDKSERGIL